MLARLLRPVENERNTKFLHSDELTLTLNNSSDKLIQQRN